MTEPLLSVRSLSVAFPAEADGEALVVEDVSFQIGAGEIVALVGESGSGKSVTGLALMDLVPEPGRIVSGEVWFEGRDVLKLDEPERQKIRGGGMGLVFQEPGTALDPVRTIGSELVGVLRRHRGLSRTEARRAAAEWLGKVSLPDPFRRMNDLPHRMSGGMRQRAMLALALAGGPRLLIADEPTTALDVTIQAQILDLLRQLSGELGLAILLITHDLGVVAEVADRALVMYAGRIVEEAPAAELLASPAHPYTRGLLASRPRVDAEGRARLLAIEGNVPEPGHRPTGCAFHPRCPEAFAECPARIPALGPPAGGAGGRQVACLLHESRFIGNAS